MPLMPQRVSGLLASRKRNKLSLISFPFAVAVVLAVTAYTPAAEAQRFVVFGGGKTATKIADIEGTNDVSVGYAYEYFSLFFLDV